jgi:MoaA/NifB/PqqE/SkfB family radical SAM enzyme
LIYASFFRGGNTSRCLILEKMKMIKTPVIWNITNKCPYSCSFCCLDANSSTGDLSLEQKLKVIENLDVQNINLDISGGEPLMFDENLELIRTVSKKLGKDSISITSTGKGLERVNLESLSKYIYELGFTYDFPYEPSPDRPLGFNSNNLELARESRKTRIKTIAQTPLLKSNISKEIITEIYKNLSESEIDGILLIRFSESGRGIFQNKLSLNQDEINQAVYYYRNLEKEYGKPKIKITPSVKWGILGKVLTSLNVSNNGLLLSNSWSYILGGMPEDYTVLGDLTKEKFSKLVGRNVYQRFLIQLKRNLT